MADAIAESSDVNEALQRLQQEGYGLIILLDRRRGNGEPGPRDVRIEALTPRAPKPLAGHRRSLPAAPDGAPAFQINGGDLAFLKSIGIDPTRRVRGRRGAKPSPPTAPGG